MLKVANFFDPGTGYIAGVKPDFKARPGQAELAKLICKAARKEMHVIGEAPTGTGKSFAALVPAIIRALKHGHRTVISTETIALQDQYLNKDLPLLQKALEKEGLEFTFAAAKGRSNYVCNLKAYDDTASYQSRVQKWAQKQIVQQHSGDLASIDFAFDPQEWKLVGADEDCERKACDFYVDGAKADGDTNCFVFQSRKDMLAAQIVVTNHTMFLLDAEIEGHPLLGHFDMAIIDEAHSFPEKAQDCWGKELNPHTLSRSTNFLARMLKRNGIEGFFTRHDFDQIKLLEADIFAPLAKIKDTKRFDHLDDNIKEAINEALLKTADYFKCIRRDMRKLVKGDADNPRNTAIETACEKINKTVGLLNSVTGEKLEDEHKENWLSFVAASWSTKNKCYYHSLNLKPIVVAPLIKAMVLDAVPTVVFLSATLKINDSFTFMRSELGLSKEDSYEFTGEAVFDYFEQVRYYFPKNLPEQKDDNYIPQMVDEIAKLVRRTEGKTLILFTNAKLMKDVYDQAVHHIDYNCYLQGTASKAVLVEQFKDDVHSCLFATRSFFTGIDIPGDACSSVILTKAPFRVPSDPLFKARCDLIDDAGRSSFKELSLPLMLFDIKQAFGRLIRTESDSGIFALLDSRALNSGYAFNIKRTLPEARKLASL